MTSNKLEHCTDGELISRYVKHRSDSDTAMRVLIQRYRSSLHSRLLAGVHNKDDVNDLQQELWSRVARNLHRYQDHGKFEHYLSKIKTSVLTDYYRKGGREKEIFSDQPIRQDDDEPNALVDSYVDETQDTEQQASDSELIQHLTMVLIPALPVEQRAAWLLRHESEYWEASRPFEWSHLAKLNGMSEKDASLVFETARNKLMSGSTNGKVTTLDETELLIFLVWTQAQRYEKTTNFTWDYFAEILGQPVNTMKTRYRTAQKTLDKGLREYMTS